MSQSMWISSGLGWLLEQGGKTNMSDPSYHSPVRPGIPYPNVAYHRCYVEGRHLERAYAIPQCCTVATPLEIRSRCPKGYVRPSSEMVYWLHQLTCCSCQNRYQVGNWYNECLRQQMPRVHGKGETRPTTLEAVPEEDACADRKVMQT